MKDGYTSPYRLLLFLLIVFATLFVISYTLPEKLDTPLNISLRLPDTENIFTSLYGVREFDLPPELTLKAEPDFSHYQPLFPDETDFFLFGPSDTLSFELPEPVLADAVELRSLVFELQYTEIFQKDIHAFFAKLSTLRASRKVLRVLHYGDSQIEGDRVSSELRNHMQSKFGGMGPGLMSAVPLMRQHANFRVSYSGNWNRYSFQPGDLNHNRWGILFSVSRFGQPEELFENDQEVAFSIQSRAAGYPAARKFRNAKLFFGNHERPLYVELNRGGQSMEADIFPADKRVNVLQYSWQEPVSMLTVKMQGKSSPDLYALALDDLWGVAVDNIPMRGSSGLEFTRSDTALLRNMFGEFNTGMILLQFGVNVVPHIVSDYSYYEHGLFRQLVLLKKLNPGVPVIILGVSDMSMIEGGTYKSYPNIELIRNAQKNAALRAGCGFWDTYEAMGGENSMAAWVFADPPLAQKDFTHFSLQGSRIIGQMLWNALLHEYGKFEQTQKNN